MVNKHKVAQEPESDAYLIREAWQVVKRHIQYAEAMPQQASDEDLVAVIFAFHTMEGYLNYVGQRIAPELWINEQVTFKPGLSGKLNAVYERCGIGRPHPGKRPYSTLIELKKLWDRVAHRQTRLRRSSVESPIHKPSPSFANSSLASVVSHRMAVKARDDVKRIVDEINSAAISRFPQARLGTNVLEGTPSPRG
jgi:hypothetical protein